MTEPPARTFVNKERTVLVTIWPSGGVTVALRDHPDAIWGPTILMVEESS